MKLDTMSVHIIGLIQIIILVVIKLTAILISHGIIELKTPFSFSYRKNFFPQILSCHPQGAAYMQVFVVYAMYV